MKYIILTQGHRAIVDDGDYWLNKFSWNACVRSNTVYAGRRVGSLSLVFLHHFIVGFPLYGLDIDHIDNNGLNNQRENLRIITHRQNISKKLCNSTGFPGVTKKWDDRYVSYIRIKGEKTFLGTYDKPEKAFSAYRSALHSLGEELLPEHEQLWRNCHVSTIS